MMVMLHSAQQRRDDFAAGTQMNVAAEDAGFCVALLCIRSNRKAPVCFVAGTGSYRRIRCATPGKPRGLPPLRMSLSSGST
ncbi:hypothetical protein [Caballeronia sp. S22]|uniref:hypothetical protein n=1 Tax=Caballeronia sp. S22 TaxID=3137182 RepID=UPI0035309D7C